MKKETYYFSHDYNTRNDFKIKKMIMKLGYTAYGVYWALIEDLYNNDNKIIFDLELMAYDFRLDEDVINSILNDFDLFIIDNGYLSSESIARRLELRDAKSEKARGNANKRWGKSESTIKPKDHIFYVLEIYNDNENFLKCGMSSTSIARRFSGKLKSYKYNILFQCEMDSLTALEYESKINTKCESYEPSHKFGGYTECYKRSSLKDIKEILKPFAPFRNALKESKVKESKIKEIKDIKEIEDNHTHLTISNSDYDKFVKTYGKSVTDDYISRILNYEGNKKYKSLSMTLRNWIKKDGVTAIPSDDCFKYRYEGRIYTIPAEQSEAFEKEKELLGKSMKIIKTPEGYAVSNN